MDAPPAPEHGVRLTLELERGLDPARPSYRGEVRSPAGTKHVHAAVRLDGEQVTVELESGDGPLEEALAKVVRPLVRSAVRSAVVRGLPPPRRIQRWRELGTSEPR